MPSQEVLLWVMGATIVPLIGWAVFMSNLACQTRKDCSKLVEMHEKPDDYGFGTIKTSQQLLDNTRAVAQLTHYIKWFAEKSTGEKAPPYIPGEQL